MRSKLYKKTWYIKKDDTAPALAIQIIRRDNNNPLDLTGASATFSMKRVVDATPKVAAQSCIVTDATNGKLEYRWATADCDEAGTFRAEFKITLGDGTKTTVPGSGYIEVEVLERIE